jgi:alkyl hydroperoxide reductase subunit AhpC
MTNSFASVYLIIFFKPYRFRFISPEELTTFVDKEYLPVDFGGVSTCTLFNGMLM